MGNLLSSTLFSSTRLIYHFSLTAFKNFSLSLSFRSLTIMYPDVDFSNPYFFLSFVILQIFQPLFFNYFSSSTLLLSWSSDISTFSVSLLAVFLPPSLIYFLTIIQMNNSYCSVFKFSGSSFLSVLLLSPSIQSTTLVIAYFISKISPWSFFISYISSLKCSIVLLKLPIFLVWYMFF
jgi:hypothetical protein